MSDGPAPILLGLETEYAVSGTLPVAPRLPIGVAFQQVAMNLDLRHAPHVHFVRDTAEENASRVGEILDDLTRKGEIRKDESEE